ncbi:conserved hypothetical protein [Candidatus Zixiibacteriota bacterium]|nr:conserved hypothetical protein [candidate division Zixibacteria bacterium]
MKPLLVLCLGNEILSDDAFGSHVARQLNRIEYELGQDVEVVFASLAGFNLLDLLAGRKKALIVDTIITKKVEPGTVHFFPMGDLIPSRNLAGSHEISLPNALKLADLMGINTPDDIDVLAVEAQDVETLSEQLTEAVKAAIPEAVEYVKGWVVLRNQEISSNGNGEQKSASI